MKTEVECQAIFCQLLAPPSGACFDLEVVRDICVPHPFCIGVAHVAYASDHCGGVLNERAMESAPCVECYQRKAKFGTPILSLKEHEQSLTLFVQIPKEYQRDLNSCPGLGKYLSFIKAQAESLGIQGFAFPSKS